MKDFDIESLAVQTFTTSQPANNGDKSGYTPPAATGYDTCVTGMCSNDPTSPDCIQTQ